jgi:hypothetical protein
MAEWSPPPAAALFPALLLSKTQFCANVPLRQVNAEIVKRV